MSEAIIKSVLAFDNSQFKSGISESVGKTSSLKDGMGALKGQIAAAFSVTAVAAFVGKMVSLGDEVDDLSKRMGLSAETTQSLGVMAGRAGVDIGTMESSVQKLTRSQAEALTGNKQSIAAFDAMGVSISELKSLSPEQLFERVAKQMSANGKSADVVAASYDLLGKGAGKAAEVIKAMGAEGFDALNQKMRESGQIMENDVVTNLATMSDTFEDLKRAATNFAASLVSGIAEFGKRMGEGWEAAWKTDEELEQIAETQRWIAEKAKEEEATRKSIAEKAEKDKQIIAEILEKREKTKVAEEKMAGEVAKEREAALERERKLVNDIVQMQMSYEEKVAQFNFNQMSSDEKLLVLKQQLNSTTKDMELLQTSVLGKTVEGQQAYEQMRMKVLDLNIAIMGLEDVADNTKTATGDTTKNIEGSTDATIALRKELGEMNVQEVGLLLTKMNLLKQGLDAIAAQGGFPEINLPDLSKLTLPEWMTNGNAIGAVSNFITALSALATGLKGGDFSGLEKLKEFEMKIPDTSKTDMKGIVEILKATKDAKFGEVSIKIDYPEAGIPLDVSNLKLDSIDESLAILAGLKGVIWA